MLAGLAGFNGHERVPVVRRGDHHGVDVFSFEHAAVILNGLGGTRGFGKLCARLRQPALIHIAEGGDGWEAAEQLAAARAEAEMAGDEPPVRAGLAVEGEDAGAKDLRGDGRHGERTGGATEKNSTGGHGEVGAESWGDWA
jgi:hypothetical protein